MSYLITKQAKKVDCKGIEHNVACVTLLKTDLQDFLLDGGVRVKIWRDLMAIESNKKLTAQQIAIINDLLREYEIFNLVSEIAGVYQEKREFRQIKHFN